MDDDDDEMMFFWVCNAGAQNEGRGCGFWRELDVRREGRGRWFPRRGGVPGCERGEGERKVLEKVEDL